MNCGALRYRKKGQAGVTCGFFLCTENFTDTLGWPMSAGPYRTSVRCLVGEGHYKITILKEVKGGMVSGLHDSHNMRLRTVSALHCWRSC